jgi:hypothetical protein
METSIFLNLSMSFQNFSYNSEFTLSLQEQDTPSSSLFSSDMEEATGAEEISSDQHKNIPDSVKFKLQGILQVLEQDLTFWCRIRGRSDPSLLR